MPQDDILPTEDNESRPDTHPRRPPPDALPDGFWRWQIVAPLALVVAVVGTALMGLILALLFVRAQTVSVTVIVSGDAIQTTTRAPTVGDLLTELNISLGEGDVITPPTDARLTNELVVRVEKARGVTVTVDGETRLLWTTLTNPADILAHAGLEPGTRDRLVLDGTTATVNDLIAWPVPVTNITLRHAVELTVEDAGVSETVYSTGSTVGEALFEAGMTLYLADTVTPDLTTPVEPGMTVTIHRSRPVTIIADGERVQMRTQGETVADVLADAGIALTGLDYSIPDEDTLLRPGLHIRVIRVREDVVTEEAPLAYETVYQADPEMELDTRAVLQNGQDGLQETRVRVRYENGIEISREAEETTVIREPVDHVVAYGTKVVVRTIETPDGPREYWRVIRMYATSYHPEALGGDNITATGRELVKGIVAVNRNVIPFGTEVYVEGYGVGLAADTGGPRSTARWIDLGYSDADYRPWSRSVDVYILTPVPAEIDYFLPP